MTGCSAGLSPCCSLFPCHLPCRLLQATGCWPCQVMSACPEDLHPLLQVSGRVAALAMSHTASRVIQACAKHGNAAHRQALMKEVAEKPIDVAKSSYGHFLVCRLIALAGKEELAGQRPAWASQHCSADSWSLSDVSCLVACPPRRACRSAACVVRTALLCSQSATSRRAAPLLALARVRLHGRGLHMAALCCLQGLRGRQSTALLLGPF